MTRLRLQSLLLRELWKKEKEMARHLRQLLKRLWVKMDQDDILFLASGLAFNAILCLLPLLLLFVYVLGLWFRSSDSMQYVGQILDTVFPSEPYAPAIRETISAFLSGIVTNRKSLGLISLVVLLGTSASLFSTIRSVLHRVFLIKTRWHFVVAYVINLGFVMALTLLILATTTLTWIYRYLKSLRDFLPPPDNWDFHGVLGALPDLISLPLVLLFCFLLYRYVPAVRSGRRTALISAVTTSLVWEISGRAFAFYLGSLTSINRIYGAYAFVLVLLIWTFYSSLIFVIGAEVGYIFQEHWQEIRKGKKLSPTQP